MRVDRSRQQWYTAEMRKDDVFAYFGKKSHAAKAAGVSRQAVSHWREIIPAMAAIRIEKATEGRLTFDPTLYPGRDDRPVEPL